MMLTVKLTKSSSIDLQDTGPQPVANQPCWASKTAGSLNLTIPAGERTPTRQPLGWVATLLWAAPLLTLIGVGARRA